MIPAQIYKVIISRALFTAVMGLSNLVPGELLQREKTKQKHFAK